MNGLQDLRTQLRRLVPALIAVGALTLGACSSSSDDTSTDAGQESSTTTLSTDSESPDDTEPMIEAEATALLPIDAEAPAGSTMVTADCTATEEAAQLDDAPPADVHRSPIVFAVPDTWAPMGSGSGGSGSVLGTDTDMDFEVDSGDRITIDHEWDSFTMDGEIADFDGDPWTSFDYESSTGDETTEITYDEVATVTIEDQDVDLYYRDPAQAPDDLTTAQYKARIDVAELPSPMAEPGATRTYSLVVTIDFDPEDATITQDVIEAIVGSYNIPTCTWDDLLQEQELLLQVDLDGDGDVMTQQEAQQELQEQLDDLQE
jgi:hypothetical protein